MDYERDRREEELRRKTGTPPTSGRTSGGVRRSTDDDLLNTRAGDLGASHRDVDERRISRDEIRRAARDGIVDREEELKGDGLYGSSTSDPIMPATLAELVGTFTLVFGGTAVAVAAILSRPTAGAAYDSLAVALAFGLALAAVVAAVGHVSGAHVNPAVTLGMASTGKFPWKSVPYYLGAQLVGAVLGAVGTWIAFGGRAGPRRTSRLPTPLRGSATCRRFSWRY
jgi:hypothetical protein